MNILFLVHYPVFGGPHNKALRLAGPLRRLGVKTTVLLPDEPGNAAPRLQTASVDVITMPLHRLRRQGLERAAEYTWERTVGGYAQAYEIVSEKARRRQQEDEREAGGVREIENACGACAEKASMPSGMKV
jgi:hypothetical protein